MSCQHKKALKITSTHKCQQSLAGTCFDSCNYKKFYILGNTARIFHLQKILPKSRALCDQLAPWQVIRFNSTGIMVNLDLSGKFHDL